MQVSVGLLQEEVKHYLEMVLEVVEVKMMIQSASMHSCRRQAKEEPWTLQARLKMKNTIFKAIRGGTLHRQLLEVSGWILIFLERIGHIYDVQPKFCMLIYIYIYIYILPLRQLASGINESGIDFYFCEFAMLQFGTSRLSRREVAMLTWLKKSCV